MGPPMPGMYVMPDIPVILAIDSGCLGDRYDCSRRLSNFLDVEGDKHDGLAGGRFPNKGGSV
jgi:hypothetical protein